MRWEQDLLINQKISDLYGKLVYLENLTTMSHLIEIPVSAYLKKFCDSFFGNPIHLDDKTSHAIAMKVFLSYPMQMDMFYQHEPLRVFPNTIYLSVDRKKYVDIKIKKQNLQQIVKYLDRVFEEEMHRFVEARVSKRTHSAGIKRQIEEFCKLHNIEILEDVTDDAIIKQYYRYRVLVNGSRQHEMV